MSMQAEHIRPLDQVAPALLDRWVLAPLDRARRALMGVALAQGWLRPWLIDRDRRVGAHAFVGVGVALALSVAHPALLFVVGPLLLGVPHVAADVRYLLLRRAVPRSLLAGAGVFCAGFLALRVAEMTGSAPRLASEEIALVGAWVGGSAVVAGVTSGEWRRLFGVMAVVLGLGHLALGSPVEARLLFAYLHNLVGVALWVLLFRRRVGTVLPALALLAVGWAVLASGVALPATAALGGIRFAGEDLLEASEWLAPRMPGRWALGLTLSYVFLQAVHYSVWLGWLPQDDTRAEGTTSFRMSWRSLRADFRWLIYPIMVTSLLVPALGLALGAVKVRDWYLSLASFHGYLELAMLAYFTIDASALRRARADA
jgi:hypothetical protein